MPLIPNFIERPGLLKLDRGPGLLLDFLGAAAFRAPGADGRPRIFEILSAGPLTVAGTAPKIKAIVEL